MTGLRSLALSTNKLTGQHDDEHDDHDDDYDDDDSLIRAHPQLLFVSAVSRESADRCQHSYRYDADLTASDHDQ